MALESFDQWQEERMALRPEDVHVPLPEAQVVSGLAIIFNRLLKGDDPSHEELTTIMRQAQQEFASHIFND